MRLAWVDADGQGFGVALKLTFAGNNQLTHMSTYIFGVVVVGCILVQMVSCRSSRAKSPAYGRTTSTKHWTRSQPMCRLRYASGESWLTLASTQSTTSDSRPAPSSPQRSSSKALTPLAA